MIFPAAIDALFGFSLSALFRDPLSGYLLERFLMLAGSGVAAILFGFLED